MSDKELELYNKMCKNCPYARNCHESCTTCDEFERELERLENDE